MTELNGLPTWVFQAVELIAWDRETLDTYYTPETIQHLRMLMNDLGLELSEFVSTPRGMAHPDAAVRDQAVEHFKRNGRCRAGTRHGSRQLSRTISV